MQIFIDTKNNSGYYTNQCPGGEMVDTGDSKSPASRRAGSSPALGTNVIKALLAHLVEQLISNQ